jgi:hypothetical protein
MTREGQGGVGGINRTIMTFHTIDNVIWKHLKG